MTPALRVLHIEDDPLDTELASELLRSDGLNVELDRVDTLAGMREALERCVYSLILCDYTVPGMDAMEALRLARERYPGIPFIFLSGTLGEDVAINSLKQGAIDYVLKHNIARLAPAVRRALHEALSQAQQRRMQEALQESEQRFRGTFENAAVGITHTDAEGRWLACNLKLCDILGYEREELLGKSFREVTYPPDLEKDADTYARMMRGELDNYRVEKRYMRKDGSLVWFYIVRSLQRDSLGRPLYSINILEDVTERLAAEEAIRRSEAQFRQLADSMPQIVWAARPDGTLDYYNRRWYELTGAEEGLTGDDSWLPVLHPDDRQRCRDVWYECVRTGRAYEIEYRFKFPGSGEFRWHLGRALPARDETGDIVRWYGTSTDIHEPKKMREALQETKDRLRLALEASQMGCWYWDFETDTFEGDERVRVLLGLRRDDVLAFGKVLERTHADDRETVAERAGMLRSAVGEYEVEFRVIRPEGVPRWVLVKGRSSDRVNGAPMRAMGILMDISERKKLEGDLRAALISAERAKGAAENANRAKDHFLAILSHELRTPLAPVLTALQLLQKRPGAAPEVKTYLEVIRRNVELEARLIDDLLDLTRIVRGKIVLEKEPTSLRTILERVEDVCRPDIEARKLNFSMDIRGSVSVNVDASRLQQVFWNLVKNSIKFTPDGGSIRVNCRPIGDGEVIIEVSDTGIGIEPEAVTRIFNAFEQGDRTITRQFGGLGLGLAISKRLVEMQGGTITVFSAGRGLGATFTVVLPTVPAKAERAAEQEEGAEVKDAGLRRILLVEDHGDTAVMMRKLFEDSGYRVATAGDAEQALQMAGSEEFDLMVSDLGLPDQSGLELMRELRRRGSRLKGIALSGYGREEDVRRSKEAGFAEHLTKPANFDHLRSVMERLADR